MQEDEEIKCYVEGCTTKPMCGSPTPNGYRHACMKHLIEFIEEWERSKKNNHKKIKKCRYI
ncbi:hypothetical protein LCGC14_0746480 [marine sediment metagenome]|uniref:Uncharacterized protein n=1 Tax=marine sediment metagenome TaxID=412755 RepID=A0A0F9TCA5_9ZZZZ